MNQFPKESKSVVAISPDILTHPERRLRLPEVKAMTGYSTASIYAKMQNGTFPISQKMGGRAIAWKFGDILEFLNSRPLSAMPQPTQEVA